MIWVVPIVKARTADEDDEVPFLHFSSPYPPGVPSISESRSPVWGLRLAHQLEEMGSHAELMTRNGRYAHLFNLQARGYRD